MTIPRTIHFIWINERPFGYGEFASVLSALMNTSYDVLLHTDAMLDASNNYCPYRLLEQYNTRLTIIPTVFEKKFENIILAPAHISDLERLRVLYEYGGIYSDLDIIWKNELPEPLFNEQLVSAYENPAYKTVANAFIMAEKGLHSITILQDRLRDAAKAAYPRIRDTRGDFKNFLIFWKPTSEFMKAFATNIQGKRLFYLNGWRRIGRIMRDARICFSSLLNPRHLGESNQKLSFDGICGFHYYNTFFNFKRMTQLPAIREAFADVLAAIDRYDNPPGERAEADGGQGQ